MLQFFAANQVGAAQRNTTIKVGLRLRQRGFADLDVSLQLLVVDHQLAHLTYAGGQRGLCFFESLLGIGLVQSHQNVALLDVVGVIGPDFGDATGYLRHDLNLVTGHVCIIGFLEMTQD